MNLAWLKILQTIPSTLSSGSQGFGLGHSWTLPGYSRWLGPTACLQKQDADRSWQHLDCGSSGGHCVMHSCAIFMSTVWHDHFKLHSYAVLTLDILAAGLQARLNMLNSHQHFLTFCIRKRPEHYLMLPGFQSLSPELLATWRLKGTATNAPLVMAQHVHILNVIHQKNNDTNQR